MEVDLCIACCGSLPPSARERAQVFRTRCCDRPICPKCLSTNPRLSRYHPCLSCLAGVRAVASTSRSETVSKDRNSSKAPSTDVERLNLDGSLRNEDLFTLGDDEDDEEEVEEKPGDDVEEEEEKDGRGDGSRASSRPPAHRPDQPHSRQTQDSVEILFDATSPDEKVEEVPSEAPKRHYIQKSETLLGIAFKYKIDGRTLCRLNNLPMSTLSTTPHLLHTRTFLILPYDTKVTNPSSLASSSVSVSDKADSAAARHSDKSDSERTRRRTLERAAKRFQIVTKEEDWRIANAYVALAASDSISSSSSSSASTSVVVDKEEKEWISRRHEQEKSRSGGVTVDALKTSLFPSSPSSVLSKEEEEAEGADAECRSRALALRVETTARAVDAYLDDDDWEAQERARGRGPSSRLGRETSSRRAGGRGFSSWFGRSTTTTSTSAWKPESEKASW